MFILLNKSKYAFTISLLFFSILLACNSSKKFERTNELTQYLTKIQELTLEGEHNILLLQTNFCGACTEDMMDFLNKKIPIVKNKTYIILTEDKPKLIEKLPKNENVKILIDNNFMTEKYGLRFSKDAFFYFDNSEIKYWTFIDYDTFKKLDRKIF